MSNSVQPVQQGKITNFLTDPQKQDYLKSILGERKEKFVTNLISTVSQNPSLQECDYTSVLSGAIVATTLNLSLNKSFGYAYLVPFGKHGAKLKEAQFQIGYKGYIQLAMRTGEYKRLNAVPIYENQFIRWNEVEEELQLNNIDGKGAVVGYVAYFRLVNGFEKTLYWSYDKMLDHADKYSFAFNKKSNEKLKNNEIPEKDLWKYSSFWYKDFDGMALKTMFRQLLSKYGILSEEMQKAYEYDQAVINNDKVSYVENSESPRLATNEVIDQVDPLTQPVGVAEDVEVEEYDF